jgi:tetratricopeptide (TPR) repeat protein
VWKLYHGGISLVLQKLCSSKFELPVQRCEVTDNFNDPLPYTGNFDDRCCFHDVKDSFKFEPFCFPIMILFLVYLIAVIKFAILVSSDSSSKRLADAEMYFQEGKIVNQEGKMIESLPFFRAAVRLHPESTEYWMWLGVMEFRLEYYEKAKMRFDKIVSLDPQSHAAKYYSKFISEKLNKKRDWCFSLSCQKAAVEPVLQPIVEWLPELECGSHCFSKERFEEFSRAPFVIRQAQSYFGESIIISNPTSMLLQQFGSHSVDFYPQNMRTKPTKVYKVPLYEALAFLEYPEGAYLSIDISEPGLCFFFVINTSFVHPC